MKKILILLTLLAAASSNAVDISDNFTANPLTNGWSVCGDTNLFQWDSTNHNMAVTWDSSQPNSYFYHPLGTNLTTNSSFSFSFDLTLSDAQIEAGTFELAVGLLNFADATNGNFLRGTGYNATNLVEFDYFLDPFYGNSVAASEVDTNGFFADVYDDVSLTNNFTFHIAVTYFAGDSLVSAIIGGTNKADNYLLSPTELLCSYLPNVYMEPGFGNFNVDTLAIMSYDATGTYDDNGNLGDVSLLAQGTVANISFTASPEPAGNLTGHQISSPLLPHSFEVQFQSYSNWNYVVQRTLDFKTWTNISGVGRGDGTPLGYIDTNAAPNQAFYRVQAQRSN
jgi:hypothetical protein